MQGVSGLDRRCCFERLWHEVGCRAVLEELAAGRQFEFAAERAVFLTVLHRLFVSGSDRAAEKCEPTTGSRALRPFSCIISIAPWLGSASRSPIQAGASELTPCCRKDLVEEGLFARRRDLFRRTQRRLHGHHQPVLRGTGRRGAWSSRPFERLTARISSDDRRAGHGSGRQAAVLRAVARHTPPMSPPCCRSSTGCALVLASAASASSPTAGMISAQSIAALEERKLEYVLGVRERSSAKCAAP